MKFLKAYREKGDGIYQPKVISLEDKKTVLSTGNEIQLFGFGFAKNKGNKIEEGIKKNRKNNLCFRHMYFYKKENIRKNWIA